MAIEKNIDIALLDVCKAFNAEVVRYVLIGGWAVIIHGFPRLTNDIDFLIEHSPENTEKVKKALYKVFHDESIEDIKSTDIADYSVVRYVSPDGVYIDLIGRIGEVANFDTVSRHIELFEVLNTVIPVLSVEMLIKLKDTLRDKDRMDLAFLKEKLTRKKR